MLDVDPPLDGIVIETSGVADPVKLATLGRVGKLLRLNATVIAVDAANIEVHHQDPYLADTIERQITAADILAINKCDLTSADMLASVENWLRRLAPNASRLRTIDGKVPIDVILGISNHAAQPVESARNGPVHHHDHEHAVHRDVFLSWSFTADRPFVTAKLSDAIRSLPLSIVRGKGILWLDEARRRQMIFHLVGRRFEIADGPSWGTNAQRNELVFISVRERADFAAIGELLTNSLVG
jgi:G3E family GTPase